MVKIQENTLPIYGNPPLVELAIGVRFAKLDAFKVPHFGLFWNSVIEEFPKCEEAPIYVSAGETLDIETGFPLPRVWLINDADDHLLQLQKDLFLLNWRNKEGKYPHFTPIKSMYDKYLNSFREFVAINAIGTIQPRTYELSYIDHINKGEGWNNLADIGKIFPDFTWRQIDSRFLQNPSSIAYQVAFGMPDDRGVLTIKINYGKRVPDEQEIIVLDMTVRSKPGVVAENDADQWFDTAHKFVVRSFKEFCSEDIQTTFWKRKDA